MKCGCHSSKHIDLLTKTIYIMLIVVSNAVTAVSYFVITYQLIRFVKNSALIKLFDASTIVSKKKIQLFRITLGLAALFASFIALCGLTHALSVVCTFYPDLTVWRLIQDTILVLCSIVSLITAIVCFKMIPIISSILPKFELNDEGNLEHAETYMLEIVDMVKESIMVLSHDLKIQRRNEASKELFGCPSLIGKSILDFIHPEDLQSFGVFTDSAMASYSTAPRTIEYRIKPAAHVHVSSRRVPAATQGSTKAGKVYCELSTTENSISGAFTVSDSVYTLPVFEEVAPVRADYTWVESTILKHMYLDENEALQYTLEIVSRNIDARKKIQQTQFDTILKETEEESRINAAKMRYLSCIAHDLKTPLQSFCYTLDLLLQTKLHKEQREIIQQANVAVDLMKLTISQTMDISKARTGAKLLPRRTTVYLSSVIKRVEIIISGYGKQVPVSFETSADIVDEIITDEEWLWQMLLNLLTNACKYTDKGSITVRVSLSGSPSNHMLLFEVLDTGVGVSDHKLSIMFDAFAQVQESQVTGTGLGLYGVRMRAEGLQGSCGARHNTESSTGTGTVMWFAVPYVPDCIRCNVSEQFLFSEIAEGDHPSPYESPSSGDSVVSHSTLLSADQPRAIPSELAHRAQEILSSRPLTAMVVEDTLTVRKLMERMLLQMGFAKVLGYENGSKGLDAMMAEPVDIVFSDVQMPIMTGPEMVSRFRKFEIGALAAGIRSKRQIVVAVTANGSELRSNISFGFDDVYPKPLGRNDIYEIINEYL